MMSCAFSQVVLVDFNGVIANFELQFLRLWQKRSMNMHMYTLRIGIWTVAIISSLWRSFYSLVLLSCSYHTPPLDIRKLSLSHSRDAGRTTLTRTPERFVKSNSFDSKFTIRAYLILCLLHIYNPACFRMESDLTFCSFIVAATIAHPKHHCTRINRFMILLVLTLL